MGTGRKYLFLSLLMAWLFVVIPFYYWGHQFSLVQPLIGLIRIAIQMSILSLLCLVAYTLGRAGMKILRLRATSRVELFVFVLGTGFAVMGLLTLAANFLRVLKPLFFWTASIIFALPALLSLWRARCSISSQLKTRFSHLCTSECFLLAYAALVLAIGIQLALAPPIAWDGLSIHLVLVKDAIRSGFIEPSQFSNQPLAGHLLFIWGMAMGGETLPQLISYTQAILIVVIVGAFSNRHFGQKAAVLAVAILCSVEVFILTAAWPYLDVPVGFFVLLAILALAKWQVDEKDSRAWIILASFFAATAVHTKLNGLFVYPAMLAGIALGTYWKRSNWRKVAADIAIALMVIAILSVVWLTAEKSLRIDSGSVVTSAATSIDSVTEDLSQSRDLAQQFRQYFRTVWEMTEIGQLGGLNYDGTISPLFLIFIPMLALLPGKPPIVKSLILATIIELLAWLLVPRGYYQNRHLIMAFPLAAILVAYLLVRLHEYDTKLLKVSGFVRILLVVVLTVQLIFYVRLLRITDPSSYLIGLIDRDQYLSHNLNGGTAAGYYTTIQYINDELPADSVVGIPWPEPRTYHCQVDCIRYPFSRDATVEEMAKTADEIRLTHLLLSPKSLDYWIDLYDDNPLRQLQTEDYANALYDLGNQYGNIVFRQDDSYILYALVTE